MRVIPSLIAAALLVAASVPAAAQTSGQFRFTDGSPYDPQPTLSVGSGVASKTGTFYTSIYRGQFMTGGVAGPQVDIFCVDFFRNASSTTYNAWFTPLSATDFSHTYGVIHRGWTDGIAEERYRAAAYIAATFNPADKASWPAKQAAIWSLMGHNLTDQDPVTWAATSQFDLAGFANTEFRDAANAALNGGLTNAGSVDADTWTIISAESGSVQEFMVQQSVVPEPETVILLVTGLLAVGAVAYFRGFSA